MVVTSLVRKQKIREPFVLLGLAAVAGSQSPAVAQEQDAPTVAKLGEQTVTGSRIRQPEAEAYGPLNTITRTDIDKSSRDSVGRLLQDLPAVTGSPMNTNVNNGGDGSTRIDLRGLGADRTLVLVNGRRFVNSGSSVDLSSIPMSLVERIEVLKDGASPVYGSDAIGGVANIITRADYEGVEFAADWSQTTQGDGEILTVSGLGGISGEQWNVAMGADWTDASAVYGRAREYSASQQTLICPDDPENPTPHCPTQVINVGSNAIPQGAFLLPVTPFGPEDFDFYTLDAGTNEYRPAVFDFVPDNDFYNYGAVSYLQTPNKRGQVWLQGHYDVNEQVRLFTEALYYHRDSDQLLAPLPYQTNFHPGAPLTGIGNPEAAGLTGVDARSFYNPFGVDLFNVKRRMVEIGGRHFTQEVETWRVVGGASGNVRDWHWEVALNWGKDTEVHQEFGQFLGEGFALALGPSGRDAPGSPHIVCGVPVDGVVPAANVIPGCVPIDLFHGVGTITPEMLDHLRIDLTDRAGTEQRDVLAYVSGELLDLPAGPLALSAGIEYREEEAYSHPDAAKRPGGSTGGVEASTDGSFDVSEIFFEVSVPVLREVTLADRLDLSFGGRYTDVSTFGSNTSFMGGLQWRPVRDLLLRAHYAQVFRAPTISDLFEGQVDVPFDEAINDPCAGNSGNPAFPGCAGVPPGYDPEGVEPLIRIGGNPDAAPEEGETVTFGLVYTPSGLPGFRAALDHFDIHLDDALGGPDFELVLERCALTGDPQVCDLVERHPVTGEPTLISAIVRNFGDMNASGIDLDFGYQFGTAVGQFEVELLATYLDQRDELQFPGQPRTLLAGTFAGEAFPRWRTLGSVQWSRGGWSAGYLFHYINSYHEYDSSFDALAPDAHGYSRDVASSLYHDVRCEYSFAFGTHLSLAVLNVTDEVPPRVNATSAYANTDPATYDLLGRSYQIGIRHQFR